MQTKEVTRLFDLLERIQTNFQKEDILAKKENNVWVKYSSSDFIENSDLVSYGLLALGLEKGDKVATVSNNRPEWNFVDMGCMQAGIVHVPIYPTISSEEYEYILGHSEAKIIFISDKQLYNKILPILDKIPVKSTIYTFNEIEGAQNWSEIIEKGKENKGNLAAKLQTIKASISPDDVASIIYTSGTTGVSKGVMLSHSNFVSNFISARGAMPLGEKHKVLSFLPLCHVYERMLCYMYLYKGVGIYYAVNMGTISENLRELHVDGFCTVPRLLEKVYDTIITKGKNLPLLTKIIFFWAVHLGLRYEMNGANGWFYELKLKIANKLVFSKWREALGGSIKFIGCGGAALQPRLARIFWAARIPIQEGYGLTETSPLIAMNYPDYPNVKLGTVGMIVPDVQVKIADDGEILCKGPNVMKGYYKNPELTQEAIDEEGWFRTGDIGELIEGKYLKITDRKKEIFKSSAGKYIAPQVIENKLKESFLIGQVMVVGENEKFASALISPNFPVLHTWADRKKILFKNNAALITNPTVIARFQREVNEVNKTLGEVEKIKRFRLVNEEWTSNTGELSPTLKLRRKFVETKYDSVLEEIYGHPYKKGELKTENPTNVDLGNIIPTKQILDTLQKVKDIVKNQ
jgi:long-chain acyl-CoA synthetase